MNDLKWDFLFDVGSDGKVLVRITDLDTGHLTVSMDLPPADADRMGDALKAQADRSRRKYPA
jgi:hypothetical protein